jgi:hypothetical protein
MRSISLAVVAILAAAVSQRAEATEFLAPSSTPSSGGFWIGADYLNWSSKGDKLPPLVTTSLAGTPLAQAGVLGASSTTVLFGNASVADGWRSGVRVSGGYWFDAQHSEGIEAQLLFLGNESTEFSASSGATPILAEPFTDAVSGMPNASLIAFPGTASGSIAIRETSRLFGTGAAYRRELCSSCAFGSISAFAGYRYLRLRDGLAINDSISPLSPIFPSGSAITASDQFNTTNNFHGLDLGLTGDVANGPWRLSWLAKIAVGGTFVDSHINGSNSIAIPGTGTTVSAGGFYTQPSNIGSTSSNRFAVAPELGLTAGYQFTDNLRAVVGYSLLYWTGLVRPGGRMDTTINTSQLNGGILAGPARPQARMNTTDYWAQGFNLGLVFNP